MNRKRRTLPIAVSSLVKPIADSGVNAGMVIKAVRLADQNPHPQNRATVAWESECRLKASGG
jgi:hypothetical protein